MNKNTAPRPVVLCILDGWGYLPEGASSGIRMARMPNWSRLIKEQPFGLLEASALDVGLPAGQMGNSEVGHMNLGAGRVVMQELVRVDAALADGSLATNPALTRFIATLKQSGGTAHLMGLLSPGGVHSHQDHILGLARILATAGIKVAIHAFTDGRDTPPRSGAEYLAGFEADLAGSPGAAIATVIGRYYAMDRDNRWDRVGAAYAAMVAAVGHKAASAAAAIAAAYDADKGYGADSCYEVFR